MKINFNPFALAHYSTYRDRHSDMGPFRDWCYNKYKLAWLLEHEVDLTDMLESAVNFAASHGINEDFAGGFKYEEEHPDRMIFYRDFATFLENEYRDPKFIENLLGGNPADMEVRGRDKEYPLKK